MNLIKTFIILFLLMLILAVFVGFSYAADQTITCDPDHGCHGLVGTFFYETNIKPLDSMSRTMEIRNDYPQDREFALEVKSVNFIDSSPAMAKMLNIVITSEDGMTTYYGPKTIQQWKDDGYNTLTSIPEKGHKTLKFIIDFANADNNYQGKTLKFDLDIGFESLPIYPTPTPGSSTNSNSSDNNSSNNSSSNTSSNTVGSVLSSTVGQVLSNFGYGSGEESPNPAVSPANEMIQTGDVFGSQTCRLPWWWIIIFLLHLLLAFIFNKICKKKQGILCYINQILLSIFIALIYYFCFCNHWLMILALLGCIYGLFIVWEKRNNV